MTSEFIRAAAAGLAAAPKNASTLAREVNNEISRAATYVIPGLPDHLAPDTVTEMSAPKRRELDKTVREQAARLLADQQERVASQLKDIRNAAEKERPRIGDDPASLIRSEQKWKQTERQLDAGIPLPRVIANADLDTVLAIEEWAPARLAAEHEGTPQAGGLAAMFDEADPKAALADHVANRLTQIAAPSVADTLRTARIAERDAAAAQIWHNAIDRGIRSSAVDMLSASIGAQYAAAEHSATGVDGTAAA